MILRADTMTPQTDIVTDAADTQAKAVAKAKAVRPNTLNIAKKSYNISEVEKAVSDALSIAGRAKKVALTMGLTKAIREIDGGAADIVPPSVVNQLSKAGKLDRAHARRILAANRLLDAIDTLLSDA